jgi:serine O-acetyltransferase
VSDSYEFVRANLRDRRTRHAGFREAVLADARVTAAHRPSEIRGIKASGQRIPAREGAWARVLRLAWESDTFLALMLYRAKARLQSLGVPVLPRLFHRLTMAVAQVSIGDQVVMQPGVYLLHGQVVIDGVVEISGDTVIGPFVTIGLVAGDVIGPTIGRAVRVGTGAKILGPLQVGAGAVIGANSVVLSDVPAGATAVGVPAHIVASKRGS